MRILITGAIVFVIWCFFSSWLYNDILLPVMRKPVPVLATPVSQTNEADSLMKLKASMPKNLRSTLNLMMQNSNLIRNMITA
jgi:hypothetical protein